MRIHSFFTPFIFNSLIDLLFFCLDIEYKPDMYQKQQVSQLIKFGMIMITKMEKDQKV